MSRDRVYWDACCFLGWLQSEADKQESCRAVLADADAGKIIIVTSALTLAEVLAMRRYEAIDRSRRESVEAFFRRDYIAVQNVTRRTAEDARALVWDHGIAPKDAIHVATAISAKVSSPHTFDGPLMDRSGKVGSPLLVICRPFVTEPKLDLRPLVKEAGND